MALSGLEQQGLVLYLGDVGSTTVPEFPLLKPKRQISVLSAALAAKANVTANATNYKIFSLRTLGTTNNLAQINTSAIGLTAATFRDMGSISPAYRVIDPDETLTLKLETAGAGVTVTGLTIQVNYEITA